MLMYPLVKKIRRATFTQVFPSSFLCIDNNTNHWHWEIITMNETRTWFSTSLHTLLMRVEAIVVPTAASIPEARAALAGGIVVPLEDELGTSAFLFGELANVHSCRGRCEGSDRE